MRLPRSAFLLALAAAGAVAGCSTVQSTLGLGNEYEIVTATPEAITLRYRGDDESLAAGRAQDHCRTHGRRAELQSVTPGDDDWKLAIYDCRL